MGNASLRYQEFELIEAASADELSQQFEILMTTFDLGQEYRDALSTALRNVEWRTSDRPLKTIYEAILGAAFGAKAKKSRNGASVGLSTGDIGALAYHADTMETIRGRDGVWRQGGGANPEWNDTPRSYYIDEPTLFGPPDRLITRVRQEFIRTIDPREHLTMEEREWIVDPFKIIDWHSALTKAGLDDFEQTIFHSCFRRDRGQSKTIAEYSDELGGRKEIEAAIKRVRRKLKKIRAVIFY